MRSEREANEALARAVARKEEHTRAANYSDDVNAFRSHIRQATDAWAEERRLRALIRSRYLPA
jgi:uncharacterized protein YhaN